MRIVLISDDSDFFEYISPKLILRKSDELFRFSFDEVLEKLHLLSVAAIIINSENSEDKTIELLKLLNGVPAIIFAYNDSEEFRITTFKNGALSFITPMTSDKELQAKMLPLLAHADLLEKNNRYREILVDSKLLASTNEVYLNYAKILDKELDKIDKTSRQAILAAISPDDKTKFLLQANQIETIILNNIRQNDVLMNYAANKYFMLLYDVDIKSAKKIWNKIAQQIPQKIYAGFTTTLAKKRQQVINEVLNRLHEAINYEKLAQKEQENSIENFKLFRQEFNKKIEKIIQPVFYQTRLKYNDKLFGMTITQASDQDYSSLTISARNCTGVLKITAPGFSKINIDIIIKDINKRISLEPNELEAGFLEDLIEQFINEFKKEIENDITK